MIEFMEITEENFSDVINLEIDEYQKREKFVAPNVRSLAECYLYRHENDVFPYAIVTDGKAIGFILIDTDETEKEFMIWRMMIDKDYQRKGFGRQTVQKAIQMASDSGKYDTVIADYVDGNDGMGRLLRDLGFKDDSFNEAFNEYVLHYDLTKIE